MIYKILIITTLLTVNQEALGFGWFKKESKPQKPAILQDLENSPLTKQAQQSQIMYCPVNIHTASTHASSLNNELEHYSILESCRDFQQQATDAIKSHSLYLTNWIKQNKKKSILIAIGSSWAGIQGYIFYLSKRLKSPNCWSLWKEHLTVKELYGQAQEILAKEILQDIQKAYTTVKNPTDFVTPLIAFLNDTYYEEKHLYRYEKIIRSSQKIYLNKILFYDQNLYNSINQRLAKLEYIKTTFLTWLANYKINTITDLQRVPSNIRKQLRRYRSN